MADGFSNDCSLSIPVSDATAYVLQLSTKVISTHACHLSITVQRGSACNLNTHAAIEAAHPSVFHLGSYGEQCLRAIMHHLQQPLLPNDGDAENMMPSSGSRSARRRAPDDALYVCDIDSLVIARELEALFI